MQRLYITICCLMTSCYLFAQYSLTAKNNSFHPGDTIIKQQIEYVDPGPTGKNIAWNFLWLTPVNEKYKLSYFTPKQEDTTLIAGLEHNTRYYYLQKKDSLLATGFENATTYMRYVHPELLLRFPLAYGDTIFSRFSGVGEYSHRIPLGVKGYTRVQVDAEGELSLPQFKTIRQALRVHTLRHYSKTGKDSVEMDCNIYTWYAAGSRYPVFECIKTNIRKMGNPSDTTVYKTSFYYPPEGQPNQIKTDSTYMADAKEDISSVFTEANFNPNPVENDLHINYKLTRSAKVWFSLHSNVGIPLKSTAPESETEGYYNTSINMSSLISGTYALYVHVDDMVMRQVVIKK